MQTFRNIIFASFYFVVVISVSCNEQEKIASKKNCRVQIAFEPNFYNESRIDTVTFSKTKFADTSKNTRQFENYVGQENYIIESGEITISATSVFERKYSKTINITSDTSIIFHKSDFLIVFEETDAWDKDLNLKNNDTLVVYYFNGSCSTTDEFASVRKISLFKSDTNYLAKYTDLSRGTADIKSSYKTKQLGSNFVENIKSFYIKAKAEKEKKQDIISTSNSYMFIRIDNKIYQITDPHFFIGNLYDNLIKEINGS
jgi:hypothetical protein